MKDEVRSRLEKTFADFHRTAALEKAVRQERQALELEALNDFHVMCRETIRPVMEEFVELLASRGIKAEITTTVEDLTEDRPIRTASIKFGVLINPVYAKRAFDVPGFTVFCDKRHRTVRFQQSTIGRNAPGRQSVHDVGHAEFEAVTADAIQDRVAAFVIALFG